MFNFGGLASGLDTNALISGLMGVERIPLQLLHAKQRGIESAQSTVSSILGKITAVKTAAEELSDASGFSSLVATSDAPAVVATASGAGAEGTFSIEVTQLAQEQRNRSDSYSDSVSALGLSGNMDFAVGSDAAVSISVEAGDSLAGIAAKINSSGARVSASVVEDQGSYRLLVRGTDTGSSNGFTVTGSATLGLDSIGNQYQKPQNAVIKLDGTFTIDSSTNQFTNVVDGIDIAVTAETSTPATVTIERDGDTLKGKIEDFVSAYNDAISASQLATGFGPLNAQHIELASDSTLRGAMMSLSSAVSSSVSGLSGKYDMLASVGVHLTQSGKLELDSAALEEALQDDVAAVEKVFVGDPTANVDGAMAAIISVVDRYTDGDESILQLKVDAMDTQVDRLEEDAIRLERRLDDYEVQLQKKFTALELAVSQIQAQQSALTGLINMSINQG